MKILRVRFLNLNSLRGEHTVDFSQTPLSDAGLFAITGPTGAGKTTILDAITLALYGQVPRHESSGPEHVMSHGTGESWAEVEFEVNGRQYRSKWGQYRARKRPEGNLQPPAMELSERKVAEDGTETWPFLETYKSKVPPRIAELSGLEYKQFLRSVLLAQGDFTRFLKAPAGERAQLLEKITDTRKYSDISRAAFERAKQENLLVEQLRQGLEGVTLLSPEEATHLETELHDLNTQLTRATATQEQWREARQWHLRLQELRDKLHTTGQRQQELAAQAETLAPLRQRLALHQQAAPFATDHALLRQTERQVARVLQEAEQLRTQLPQLQERRATAETARNAAQQAHEAATATQKTQEPKLREAEQLDLLMAEARRQLTQGKAEYEEKNEQCKRLKAAAEQAGKQASALQAQVRDAEKWLLLNTVVSELAADLPELSANLQQWAGLKTALGQLSQRLHEARQRQQQAATEAATQQLAADAARQQLLAHTARFEEASKTRDEWLQRLRYHVGSLQQQQDREQQHWDDLRRSLQMQQLILSHTETRLLLEAGQPCPVCGATEHPYMAGVLGVSEDSFQRDLQREETLSQQVRALGARFNRLNTYVTMLEQTGPEPAAAPAGTIQLLPETAEKTAAEEVKLLVQTLRELRDQQTTAGQRLHQAQTQHEAATRQHLAYTEEAGKLAQELADAEDQVLPVRTTIQSQAQYFSLPFTNENGQALMELARQRILELELQTKQLNDARQALGGVSVEATKAEAHQQELQAWLKVRKQELVDQHHAIQRQQQQRQALLPDADVARARQQLEEAVRITEQQHRHTEQQLLQHETAYAVAANTLRQREQDARQQQQAQQQQHAALVAGLTAAGLAPNPAALPALLLPDPELHTLQSQLRRHEQDVALATQTVEETARQLTTEENRRLTPEPLDAVNHYLAAAGEQLAALHQQVGQRQERLNAHRTGQERHATLAAQLEKQQQEARRWRELAELIGSADGKKFSEFAQGLTLARLVDLANRHLHRFTDRYRILRNPEQHLDLLIQDDYQAGAARTMNSLSGGESFLVSLALALGLSELAGRRTQIDTLFIDEGFGTLDPETLDVALSALELLQGTGKSIGIISHVEGLKERISTQISVQKGAGGISSLRVLGFGEDV
ncbi:AAA family ATPase [Hymenobacter psychrotolerans]|uniref:Exonuclease SbcC n=1 Tax=Hymenobacter psychrotolerans DSM 18569 TaxID=1121959 RepID=A0A1M7H8M3_9BACT|nr:AAA family ATPase [Hymenobacter psychrotolerans]SHM24941.1 exonuclease SbcC [Hymenobacter psychrotolerans DSM 18569]